ncbi:MAG: hypothetical protein ABIP94_23890 [Planctomycetota bacterium]
MSEGSIDSDVELVAIAAGDGDAFARWLARAEAPLRRSLRRFASSVDTEAVLQEALLRVWQVAPRCVPDDKPHGLLRLAARIVRNLAISESRRHHVHSAADEAQGLGENELSTIEPANVPDANVRAAVAACRDKLPAKPRAAIDARIAADGSDDDHALAARLAMRTNTFLQNVTRARRVLAECLRRAGIDLDLEMV